MSQWGTVEQRFWQHVDASGGLDACWPWTGYRDNKGYGMIAYDGIRSKRAHRLSVRLAGVTIPTDMLVLHSCDNPPCVNPAHLRVGTQADNVRDMYDRGRGVGPWSHCKRGHAVTGDNARIEGKRRRCRTCLQVTNRKGKAVRRARLRAPAESSSAPSAPPVRSAVSSDDSAGVRRRSPVPAG